MYMYCVKLLMEVRRLFYVQKRILLIWYLRMCAEDDYLNLSLCLLEIVFPSTHPGQEQSLCQAS